MTFFSLYKIIISGEVQMKSLFTHHPRLNGETYWQHLKFAHALALQYAISSFFLVFHGIIPAFSIPEPFDMISTNRLLLRTLHKRNNII